MVQSELWRSHRGPGPAQWALAGYSCIMLWMKLASVDMQVAITKRTEANTATALFSGFEFPLGGRLLEVSPMLHCNHWGVQLSLPERLLQEYHTAAPAAFTRHIMP
jgi:hypothetical protein